MVSRLVSASLNAVPSVISFYRQLKRQSAKRDEEMGCTNSTEEQCPKMQAAEAARVAAAATCNNIDEYIKQHLPVGSKKEIQFTDGT